MKRTKFTGKGVDLLEEIAYVFDEDLQNNLDRVGSIQVRLAAP